LNENVLQVLLILAYLAIGLISVTFPIYAICVTYLRREKWETEKERKKRIESIKKHIAKLTDELSGEPKDSERFKQIQDRIEKHQNEKESLEYLTAKGAVRKPIILFALALLSTILGIQFLYMGYMELELALICGVFSGAFSIKAVYRLYKTISSIEYAALRPARTIEFDVAYRSREQTRRIKVRKETEVWVSAGTDEENIESFVLQMFFPPKIEIENVPKGVSLTIQPEGFNYPNYTMMGVKKDFVPKGTSQAVRLTVIAKKIGRYRIPVIVHGKGIHEYETELTLNVVK